MRFTIAGRATSIHHMVHRQVAQDEWSTGQPLAPDARCARATPRATTAAPPARARAARGAAAGEAQPQPQPEPETRRRGQLGHDVRCQAVGNGDHHDLIL